ncbi:3-keto-disaccharide hydrolase [Flavitalea flava]
MKKIIYSFGISVSLLAFTAARYSGPAKPASMPATTSEARSASISGITVSDQDEKAGWISLFDGKSLTNWKVGNNAETFSVEDGKIVVHGKTAHLFYVGDFKDHNFKNFELKADVMTEPGSNSGIYFHTQYQESGWPDKGFEVQVNNSHTDWKRTGSLYDIVDVKEVYVKDKVWFTEHIIVKGKRVVIKINDKTVVDYTEPENVKPPEDHPGRLIGSGTFALQGHDPKSIVYFKNIRVKPLD